MRKPSPTIVPETGKRVSPEKVESLFRDSSREIAQDTIPSGAALEAAYISPESSAAVSLGGTYTGTGVKGSLGCDRNTTIIKALTKAYRAHFMAEFGKKMRADALVKLKTPIPKQTASTTSVREKASSRRLLTPWNSINKVKFVVEVA